MAFVPLLPADLDFPEILAMLGPAATMVLNCKGDPLYTCIQALSSTMSRHVVPAANPANTLYFLTPPPRVPIGCPTRSTRASPAGGSSSPRTQDARTIAPFHRNATVPLAVRNLSATVDSRDWITVQADLGCGIVLDGARNFVQTILQNRVRINVRFLF
jgi:hypothetical protein